MIEPDVVIRPFSTNQWHLDCALCGDRWGVDALNHPDPVGFRDNSIAKHNHVCPRVRPEDVGIASIHRLGIVFWPGSVDTMDPEAFRVRRTDGRAFDVHITMSGTSEAIVAQRDVIPRTLVASAARSEILRAARDGKLPDVGDDEVALMSLDLADLETWIAATA